MRRLAVAALLLLTGCATETNYVRFHTKNPQRSAELNYVWYPVKDSVTIKTEYRPGKPYPVKGDPTYIFANCDSAYQSAYDEAIRLGQKGKVVVPPVRVLLPPNTHQVDTIASMELIIREATSLAEGLRYELGKSFDETAKERERGNTYQAGYNKARKRNYYMASGYALLFMAAIGYGYFRLKAGYVNTAKNIVS